MSTIQANKSLLVLLVVAAWLSSAAADGVVEKRTFQETLAPPDASDRVALVVDNVFGSSTRWIDDLSDPDTEATDRMNRMVAADPGFEATAVAARSGILIARRTPA